MLLNAGVDPDQYPQEKNLWNDHLNEPKTCLESAVRMDHVDVVRELLKGSVDCNAVTC